MFFSGLLLIIFSKCCIRFCVEIKYYQCSCQHKTFHVSTAEKCHVLTFVSVGCRTQTLDCVANLLSSEGRATLNKILQ